MLGEGGALLRAVIAIVAVAAIVIGSKVTKTGKAGGKPPLPPNLVAFGDLPPADQRMFRRCLEGLGEAEDARSRTGKWPDVGELAARGIPPFAADPIDRAGYRWVRFLDGTLVNYLGTPEAGSKRPSFLIVALEPDPGTPSEPGAVVDQSHHKLRDGTVLHISTSIGPARTLGRPLAMPPVEDGWRTIILETE
jgi:hypothetical protein